MGTGLPRVTFLGHPLPLQIWTLLPGFCTRPTDVAVAFKGLARTLGTAISERPDLRVTVCQALRTLITKGCEAGTCGVRLGGGPLLWREFPDPVWPTLPELSLILCKGLSVCWGPEELMGR